MISKIKDFFSAARERAAYVLGGMAAALFFALAFVARSFARGNRNDGGAGANVPAESKKYGKEKEEIERKADEAHRIMRDHLSGISASELCDGYGECCDAIHDGKGRLGKRFDGYKSALHAGRGGCDD